MGIVTRSAIVVISASLTAFVACGGDAEPAGTDPGNGGSTSASNSSSDTSSSSSSSSDTSSSSSSSSTSSGQTGECGPSSIDMNDPCEVCVATKCTAEALACCNAPGCLDIVFCAQETGCGGIDCYAPDKCQEEIDAAGIDVAQNEATNFGECVVASCAAECGVEGGGGGGGEGSGT